MPGLLWFLLVMLVAGGLVWFFARERTGKQEDFGALLQGGVDKARRWLRQDKTERTPLKQALSDPEPVTASLEQILADAPVVESGYIDPSSITDPIAKATEKVTGVFKRS